MMKWEIQKIKPKLNLTANTVIHYRKMRSSAKHLMNTAHSTFLISTHSQKNAQVTELTQFCTTADTRNPLFTFSAEVMQNRMQAPEGTRCGSKHSTADGSWPRSLQCGYKPPSRTLHRCSGKHRDDTGRGNTALDTPTSYIRCWWARRV